MQNFNNWLRKLQRNNCIYIIAILQIICLVSYVVVMKWLKKDAGFNEVFSFLFNKPGQFFLSLILGISALVLLIVWLISVIVELPFVKELLDYDYYSDEFENIEKWKLILNLVLLVIMMILSYIFLKSFSIIFLVAVALILVALFLAKK